MLFDTHTHINIADFDADRDQVIQRAHEVGVTGFAIVGFDVDSITRAQKLAADNKDMVSIIGWHPVQASEYTPAIEQYLLQSLANDRVVALGETGLDYYWPDSPRDVQARVFRRQIAIARERHLPIVIHNREATADVYRILKEEKINDIGGIMHSFGEDVEWAEKFLDLGMHLSFSGVATFKKTAAVRAAAEFTPTDKILIETDAPYLAPVPKRGKRNEPAYVAYVNDCLAEVRGVPAEVFAAQTFNNACRLFQLEYTQTGALMRRG